MNDMGTDLLGAKAHHIIRLAGTVTVSALAAHIGGGLSPARSDSQQQNNEAGFHHFTFEFFTASFSASIVCRSTWRCRAHHTERLVQNRQGGHASVRGE